MKRLTLFITACLMSFALSAESITYYVETTGSNTNDGLSLETPFDSISTAVAAATAAYTANAENNDFTINIGEGTFIANKLSISNVTLTINGQGANATILEGAESLSTTGRQLISSSTNISISLNDLHLRNYGAALGTAGGQGLMDMRGSSQEITANRVAFSNFIGTFGTITAIKNNNKLTCNECNFIDITTTNNSNIFFIASTGSVTMKNCMFINCVREYISGNANTTGILLHCNQNSSSVLVDFTNNTFVDCGIVNSGGTISNRQGLIMSKSNITFTNNLICGSKTAEAADYNDIIAYNGPYTSPCTNNILTAVATENFPLEGNLISPTLEYNSAELDFVLEDDGLTLHFDTTSNGLVYATAMGDSVVGQALASVQTATDIKGTIRSNPGCIGAVEYVASGAKTPQFITFEDFTNVRLSQASPITLIDTASSGLTVTYTSSDDNIATVSGNVVTPVGIGTVTITAKQAGNDEYEAAPEVYQDLYIGADTITYYVRANGDNSNDGLTEERALATLPTAASYAVNDGVSLVYIIDVNDTITNQSSSSFNFSREEDIKVVIKGSSAAQSVYQMKNDAGFDYVVQDKGRGAGRVFQTIQNAGTGSISLEIEDMTFRNFGFTNDNGGALFNLIYNSKVNVTMKRCNMERGIARSGALIQATNGETSIVLEDCYIGDMTAINRNVNNSPITLSKNTSFSATNCVFSHCVKAAEQWGSNNIDSTIIQGNVISFTPSTDSTSLILVNNTFIGDSALRTELALPQSAVMILDTVNAQCTIANNLFVGGSATTTAAYYSIYIPEARTAFGDSTNNVMSAQYGFVETDNDIFPGLAYNDVEVAFRMDGAYPEIFNTKSGVNYVIAEGTSVSGKALASIAPKYDIAGNERNSNPSIGAFEAGNEPSAIKDAEALKQFKIYPNPASDIIYIDGDVTQMAVYNLAGQLVYTAKVAQQQVNVSTLKKGIYILKGTDKNGAMCAPETLIIK